MAASFLVYQHISLFSFSETALANHSGPLSAVKNLRNSSVGSQDRLYLKCANLQMFESAEI
jgi:hypothetical protein